MSTRIGGRWIDVASVLVAEGHALWLPNGVEWAWNREYAALSRRAAAQGLRLFDPAACGPGPAAEAALSMRVNYDAPGDDRENVDGEWAAVSNGSDSAVPLDGWWFRDSALRRYVFPDGASIPPRGTVTVYAGHGESTTTSFYWGLSAPAFENPTLDARWMGDGAYLFDPRGNLRSWVIYP